MQIALGLKRQRVTPSRNYVAEAMGLSDKLVAPLSMQPAPAPSKRQARDPWAEQKRKQAKKKRRK